MTTTHPKRDWDVADFLAKHQGYDARLLPAAVLRISVAGEQRTYPGPYYPGPEPPGIVALITRGLRPLREGGRFFWFDAAWNAGRSEGVPPVDPDSDLPSEVFALLRTGTLVLGVNNQRIYKNFSTACLDAARAFEKYFARNTQQGDPT